MPRITKTPDHPDFPHGTTAGYSRGCRCATCRAAAAAYQREVKRRKMVVAATPPPPPPPVPPVGRITSVGAVRRLQGLVFIGYSPAVLAKCTGISLDNMWWLLTAPPTTIRDATHNAIVDTFLNLRYQTPLLDANTEQRQIVARVKRLATLNNWVSPFAWDDIDRDKTVSFPARAGSIARTIAEESR